MKKHSTVCSWKGPTYIYEDHLYDLYDLDTSIGIQLIFKMAVSKIIKKSLYNFKSTE